MLHFFYGDDEYSLNQAVANLRTSGLIDAVEVVRLDARTSSAREILMAVGTTSLFGDRRFFVIEGLGETSRGSRKPKSALGEDILTVEALSKAAADGNTVVVLGRDLRSDSSVVKEAVALSRGSRAVEVRLFSAPRQRDMAGWIARQAAAMRVQLAPGAGAELVSRLGEQSSIVGIELEKLAVAAGPDAPITRELVADLVPASAEDAIFPVIDAIASGRPAAALGLMQRQLRQLGGNESDLVFRLLRLLARQFRILLQIQLMLEAGQKKPEIVVGLKLPQYHASKYFTQASRLPREQLRGAIEKIAATDFEIKNGEAGDAVLPLLVIDLARSTVEPTAKS